LSLWRQLTHGLRALTQREVVDREIGDEVDHYLDAATAAHVARGLSPSDAARAARLEIGGASNLREQVRGSGWESLVDTFATDLRYAARRLRASPGFTTIALLTLGLGIGATTAIFSAVKPILFDRLPYPAAHRLVMLREMRSDGAFNAGTFGMYRELAARSRSLDAIAVFRAWQPTNTGPQQPERFDGQRVSAGYFDVLGVRPALGRGFQPSDDVANGPPVVILSDALWRRRFDADVGIVGREITLDERLYTVIGVMPRDFENVLAPSAALWAPLQYDISQPRAWGHHLQTVARLRPTVTPERASIELDRLAHAVLADLRPETYGTDLRLMATSLQADLTRGVRPALLAVLVAVCLVLAIACVNVTNLLLARGVRRRGEFAVRAALGAARGRLIQQSLTESVLLAVLGGGIGMLGATLALRGLVRAAPGALPRIGAVDVDGATFIFALAVTTIIGLLVGLVPAMQAARSHPHAALQVATTRTTGGHRRIRHALVIAEIAIAIVVLVASGLLLRSLQRLFDVNPGFEAAGLLTLQVQATGSRFDDDSTTDRYFAQALDAVRRVPGVTAAAMTTQLPMSGDLDEYGLRLEGSAEGNNTLRYAVTPGYLETMRIPIRTGRSIEDHDVAGAPPVALLSEGFARRLFAGANPLGRRVQVGPPDSPLFTIVGTVAEVKQLSLASTATDAVYIPAAQWPYADRAMSVVVRGRGARAIPDAAAVREAIWSVDRNQPIVRVEAMTDLLASTTAERRFVVLLFEMFAITSLLLAAAGIYGVIAGSVAERTREIGVRAALGASHGRIIALILRQGFALTGFGCAIGVAGSVVATRGLASMLFGIGPLDATTYAAVLILLGLVAMLAAAVPARRAARIDPATTLRTE
jgi:putative ABC transport system permease protein